MRDAGNKLTVSDEFRFRRVLLVLWGLPLISPVYEVFLAPQQFPAWIELMLSGMVFLLALRLTGLRHWDKAAWLTILSVYGAVSGFVFCFILITKLHFSLSLFFLCGICFFIVLTLSDYWRSSQLEIEAWTKVPSALKSIVNLFVIWLMISWLDSMLARRIFLLNDAAEKFGLYIATASFILIFLAAAFYYFHTRPWGFHSILMPFFIAILAFGGAIFAHQYGLLLGAHTAVFGKQDKSQLRITKLYRSIGKICPYSISFAVTGAAAYGSQCVSSMLYSRVAVGDVAVVNSYSGQFGVLLASRPDWQRETPP